MLGYHNKKLIAAYGNTHVFLTAPTRGGKGVGVVIPNLIAWQGSCLCVDIKYENFEITSKYREANGQKVFLFAPGAMRTHCWNVFDVIDPKSPKRKNTIDLIAQIICPTPEGSSQPMWTNEARVLFSSSAMAMMDLGLDVNLAALAMWVKLNANKDALEELLEKHTTTDPEGKISSKFNPLSLAQLNAAKGMGDSHLSGIVSELTSRLEVYCDPIVAAATSRSDFDLRDMRREPITIYLGATQKALATVGPIFNLLFQMLTIQLSESLPKPDEKHSILCLLDEFPALGKMDMLRKGIAYLAQYKFRFLIVAQGTSQVESIYKESGEREFAVNVAYRLAFATNDQKEAEQISKALGESTINPISKSRPSMLVGSRSETVSTAGRSLLLAQEVRRYPRDKAILLVESMRPVELEYKKH